MRRELPSRIHGRTPLPRNGRASDVGQEPRARERKCAAKVAALRPQYLRSTGFHVVIVTGLYSSRGLPLVL